MKEAYAVAGGVANKTKRALAHILDEAGPNKRLEDKKAYDAVEGIIDQLGEVEGLLNYLNAPTKRGKLEEDHNANKYYIIYDDGKESYPLSCGHNLEAKIDGNWIIGRVEMADGLYIILDDDLYEGNGWRLYRGMTVRTRGVNGL